ncbi:hypothetical protein [Microbispora sp. NPDC049633]|uniref:hypothetical protein n=1 Tax=Microbispora sp. NPDC049633 TaxID=3154355 RepID=UPI0034234498
MKTRTPNLGDVIGYTSRGPIRLIGGGSTDTLPDGSQPPAPAPTPDPAVPAPQAPTQGRLFTAEEVERFRAQERDKLHRELETTRSQLNDVTSKLSSWEQERAEAQRLREEAERKAAEEKMTAAELIEARQKEWEQRFAQLEQERAQERAILEQERRFSALQAYVQRRVREESDSIAPELIDLVNGNTEEEVEASITTLKAKTESILQNLQSAAAGVAPAAPPRGVSPAGYAATGPLETDSVQQQLSEDAIRSMSMAEYAKVRGSLLGQASQPNGRGLFG